MNLADTKHLTRRYAGGKPRKLTDAQVEEIRRRRQAGERGSALAREFGVSPGYVSYIRAGLARVHPGYAPPPRRQLGPWPTKKITRDQRIEIKELHRAGARIVELVGIYKVHKATIRRILDEPDA